MTAGPVSAPPLMLVLGQPFDLKIETPDVSLKPAGVLSQIVWRKREENPWLHDAELRVREIVPVVSHDTTDQVHCGPGPFSMAGPDMVSSMLNSLITIIGVAAAEAYRLVVIDQDPAEPQESSEVREELAAE